MTPIEKAFAYITHRGRLLVFRHPNSLWARLPDEAPDLIAGHGAMLHRLP